MKEEIISLETAKLAKEKGFKVRVKSFYSDDKFVEEAKEHIPNDWDWNGSFKERHSAPTQSLLHKWLKKDDKDIVVIVEVDLDKYVVLIFGGLHNESVENHEFYLKDENNKTIDFEKYEDALEKGLYEALKLIK